MRFYSTKGREFNVSFEEAVFRGMPKDDGLYMPEEIPLFSNDFFSPLNNCSWHELCLEIATAFLEDDIPCDILKGIIEGALNFESPLVKLQDNLYILELFHGPTLSFKDFGARFMARVLSHFVGKTDKRLYVLVATSGDTGSAVGSGFLHVQGIEVIILYPQNKVSWIQEKQLTTMGNNVTALEIDGSFDDCQKLVKKAFLDQDLRDKLSITSANSINVSRLIPQIFYYIYAAAQVEEPSLPLVFSVPSGNFGNLSAGLIAKRMGLPVHRYVASTNANDVLPIYLKTGVFEARPSIKTISNAMDVGNPSNFSRILDLYDGKRDAMAEDIFAESFSDDQTRGAIVEAQKKYGYLMDPHTAVGYLGLQEYLHTIDYPVNGVILSTAHPAKFLEEIKNLIEEDLVIPDSLQRSLDSKKQSIELSKDYEDFKTYLLSKDLKK